MAEQQLDLYPNVPGYRDTDTSKDAAKSMEPHVTRLAQNVLTALHHFGPLTCEEIERRADLRRSTASARCTELRLKGKIEDSGERRLTESGRNAIVWRLRGGK